MIPAAFDFQHSVLLIDDPVRSEAFIRSGLLSYPVQFEFCSNLLPDAVSRIEKSKCDIVLVSLDFKEGSVLDFAGRLHQQFPHVSSVYLSEPHLKDLELEVAKFNPVEVIARPNDAATLVQHLDKAMHASRERKYRKNSTGILVS